MTKVQKEKKSKDESKKDKPKVEKKKEKNNIKEKILDTVDKFDKKDYFSTFEVVIIILIAILFGFIIGNVISYTKDRTITTKVPAELTELIDTYDSIIDNYYDKKLDKKKLVDAGIKGLVDYLDDPYSMYMDKDVTEDFNETVDGKYIGIGATVSYQDKKFIIVSMYENSPTEKAGIKVGDEIIEINGKSVADKSLTDVTNQIKKSKKGTKLKLTVKREDKEIKTTITIDNVELPSVKSEVITRDDSKVGLITIDTFAANTYKQFNKELKKVEKEKIDSLIIDVRNNLGGHLNQVSKIMSLFLEKGKVIYKLEERNKKTSFKDETKEHRNYKVVILCNKSSASASELLLEAFRESYGNSVSVGVTTYGKGTVQKAYGLSSGASIKYTTEKWLTPKGHWVNEKGVKPDIKVEASEEYKENPTRENDNQLEVAINEAIKKGE